GDDLIDVVGRRAREVVVPEIREHLQRELQPLRRVLARTAAEAAQRARERVYEALNSQIPTWEQINESGPFLSWLEGHHVFTGTTRHAALLRANVVPLKPRRSE